MTLTEQDRRILAGWAAACAARALQLFETKAPSDGRPREAIEGARAFARGGKRTAKLRSLAWAAYAAARDVRDPAAAAAARAAGVAVGTAYMHAIANVHQAKHLLGPAVYAARARELATRDDGANAGDKELQWAIQRVPAAVRAVLRQMPARDAGRSRLDALYHQLDAGIRSRPRAAAIKRGVRPRRS